MSPRIFDPAGALGSPVTVGILQVVGALLILAPIVIFSLDRAGKLSEKKRKELWARTLSWVVLVGAIIVPILCGPVPTTVAVTALSLFCFREYSRATGLFRERAVSIVVVLGILLINFAAADNWYNLYAALAPLTVSMIAAVAVLADQPKGYIQRTGLGVLGFLFFGYSFGYLSFFANDPNYRPILLMIFLTTELNDVFAYITGHMFGRSKMAPLTSPGKTMEGAAGALILTTILVCVMGRWVFAGTPLAAWWMLLPLGLMIGAVGQLGDLMLSSIKRDVGIKDLGTAIPGHGGFLDRFDSLVLVTPAVFHYLHYFVTVAADQPTRLYTGG